MWLINTTTLRLQFFHSERDIRYAILSHRWEKEEVSYHEFQNIDKTTRRKLGFQKILGCCAQAKRDNLSWAWIDTCCIDKSSSAELQEAINSMFKWYQAAAECYVYLSDVRKAATAPYQDIIFLPSFPECHTFYNLVKDSQWFTRCWTLQELLAPSRVTFFDCDWRNIGLRHKNTEDLSKITKIQKNYLRLRYSPDSRPCIAEVMSWAAGRRASRIEDVAYSLLGLFDVNMPMLYGEGEEAFMRLQAEILRQSNDQSIFAWDLSALDTSCEFILAPSPDGFLPLREDYRWGFYRRFAARKATKIVPTGVSVDVMLLSVRPGLYLAQLNALAYKSIESRSLVDDKDEHNMWIWVMPDDQDSTLFNRVSPPIGWNEMEEPMFYSKALHKHDRSLVRRRIVIAFYYSKSLKNISEASYGLADRPRPTSYVRDSAGLPKTSFRQPDTNSSHFKLQGVDSLYCQARTSFEDCYSDLMHRDDQGIAVGAQNFHIYGLDRHRCHRVNTVQVMYDFDFKPKFRIHLADGMEAHTHEGCEYSYQLADESIRWLADQPLHNIAKSLDGPKPYIDLMFPDNDTRGRGLSSAFARSTGDGTMVVFHVRKENLDFWSWDIHSLRDPEKMIPSSH